MNFYTKQREFITGKSLSEALIFASTNPQYDNRLFIELQVQYMKIPSSNLERTCCVLKFRTILVHNMFSPCSAKKKSFRQRFICTDKNQDSALECYECNSIGDGELCTYSSHVFTSSELSICKWGFYLERKMSCW